jgi:putative oxidoreductase
MMRCFVLLTKQIMIQLLFGNQNDWSGFILRIGLGIVMLPHGAQKLFGWFGGYGFSATMGFFTKTLKLPWIISVLVILIELFGSVALLLGFASRVWSLGLMVIMLGAIYTTNGKNGFFMNWFGNQSGEGYEYHLLVISICIAIILTGSGKYSLDGLIQK